MPGVVVPVPRRPFATSTTRADPFAVELTRSPPEKVEVELLPRMVVVAVLPMVKRSRAERRVVEAWINVVRAVKELVPLNVWELRSRRATFAERAESWIVPTA